MDDTLDALTTLPSLTELVNLAALARVGADREWEIALRRLPVQEPGALALLTMRASTVVAKWAGTAAYVDRRGMPPAVPGSETDVFATAISHMFAGEGKAAREVVARAKDPALRARLLLLGLRTLEALVLHRPCLDGEMTAVRWPR